jgi:hypothetical protein
MSEKRYRAVKSRDVWYVVEDETPDQAETLFTFAADWVLADSIAATLNAAYETGREEGCQDLRDAMERARDLGTEQERRAWIEAVFPGNLDTDLGRECSEHGPTWAAEVLRETETHMREAAEVHAEAARVLEVIESNSIHMACDLLAPSDTRGWPAGVIAARPRFGGGSDDAR